MRIVYRFNWVFLKTVGCHLCEMFVYYYLPTHTHMQITNNWTETKQSNNNRFRIQSRFGKTFSCIPKKEETRTALRWFSFCIYPILILFAELFLFSLLRLVSSVYLEYHSLWSFPFIKWLPNSPGGKYQTKKICSKQQKKQQKNLNICSNVLFAIVLIENPFIFLTNFCTNFRKPKREKNITNNNWQH